MAVVAVRSAAVPAAQMRATIPAAQRKSSSTACTAAAVIPQIRPLPRASMLAVVRPHKSVQTLRRSIAIATIKVTVTKMHWHSSKVRWVFGIILLKIETLQVRLYVHISNMHAHSTHSFLWHGMTWRGLAWPPLVFAVWCRRRRQMCVCLCRCVCWNVFSAWAWAFPFVANNTWSLESMLSPVWSNICQKNKEPTSKKMNLLRLFFTNRLSLPMITCMIWLIFFSAVFILPNQI